MQISKNHIKRNITNAALKLFKAKDYSSVSMREIASEAQVGLSNIYNYFRSKDELFCHIVQPAVSSFERMLEEHHGYEGKDIMEMQSEKYLLYTVSKYLKIINKHGEEISILFFKANGSSLQNFKEEFTEKSTFFVRSYFEKQKILHPEINIDISDFFIHLHCVWMFTLIEELLMHGVEYSSMEKIVNEYIRFEISGWKKLLEM